ncbi:REP-associated tyrosine transposase [Ornithinibacillus contaminans]|uniref:REP-associated tyrosine transposase n=1 Tax=Ornithinibacillus contaminans TaxID=694055 RepID=UPI00064DCA43|nr:transposase [Ornithinibacillus contaminans]
MGRKKREWLPGYYYHIVCRGNQRDDLFKTEIDYRTFFYLLKEVKQKTPFDLAAYCLMSNHFHLQMRSDSQTISKVMSLINKRYADYYNTKNNLTGHVFEKRYFDRLINTDLAMLRVSRYIHLNPLKAGLVETPESYRWSSYRLYLHTSGHSMLNVNAVLDCMDGNALEKRQKYQEFVNEEKEIKEMPMDGGEIVFF